MIAFVGAALVATAGGLALLRVDGVKPIGRLSRAEVQEVCGVVKRSFCPQRSLLKLAKFRQWPSFAWMTLTFRVVDIRVDSIGIITIHPDGTRDECESGATVWYTYSGSSTNSCQLEKRNGRWGLPIGRPRSLRGLIQFPPANQPDGANRRQPSSFQQWAGEAGGAGFTAAAAYLERSTHCCMPIKTHDS